MAALQELFSKVSLEWSALLAMSYLIAGAQCSFVLKRPRVVTSQSGKMSVDAVGAFKPNVGSGDKRISHIKAETISCVHLSIRFTQSVYLSIGFT